MHAGSDDFFQKLTFSKTSFRNTIRNTIRVSNHLHQDQDVIPSVQPFCKGYQQMTKLARSNGRVKSCGYSWECSVKMLYLIFIYNIRIHHECECRIEKSVPRIAVWHQEACRVMTKGDPEGQIFLSYPHKNNGFFFLLTTVFIHLFKISFQKSLNTLRCNFT